MCVCVCWIMIVHGFLLICNLYMMTSFHGYYLIFWLLKNDRSVNLVVVALFSLQENITLGKLETWVGGANCGIPNFYITPPCIDRPMINFWKSKKRSENIVLRNLYFDHWLLPNIFVGFVWFLDLSKKNNKENLLLVWLIRKI